LWHVHVQMLLASAVAQLEMVGESMETRMRALLRKTPQGPAILRRLQGERAVALDLLRMRVKGATPLQPRSTYWQASCQRQALTEGMR
jgi:hypothetical protein